MRRIEAEITITRQWTSPVAIESGKDIALHFSKEYVLVKAMINGDNNIEAVEIAMLGQTTQLISAGQIKHIQNPVISFRSFEEVEMKVKIELRET